MMEFFKTEHGHLLAMILIIILSFFLAWLVKKFMRFIYYKTADRRHIVDTGHFLLITTLIRLIIIVVGIAYAISFEPSIETVSTSLLASAGIVTAIVGFASKDVIANFVSGFTIILFRPFTLTDWINVGTDHEGTVTEIKLLHTVITDRTNRRMIIPNSKIVSSFVINSSYRDEKICQYVEFGIAYSSDRKKAKKIIQEVAESHPFCIDNRTAIKKEKNEPIVEVRLTNFGEYAITLRALVWVNNPLDARAIRWALNDDVKDKFDEAGIEIPFPYRNLIIKNEVGAADVPTPNK